MPSSFRPLSLLVLSFFVTLTLGGPTRAADLFATVPTAVEHGTLQFAYAGPLPAGAPALAGSEPLLFTTRGLNIDHRFLDPQGLVQARFTPGAGVSAEGASVQVGRNPPIPLVDGSADIPASQLRTSGEEITMKGADGTVLARTPIWKVTTRPTEFEIPISSVAPRDQGTPGGGAPATGGTSSLDPTQATDLNAWVQIVFTLVLVLTVIAAAIFIVLGAYLYLAAAGNAELARQGKEYIIRAVMGLVLALIAWVLLKTISPQFIGPFQPTLE